MNQEEKWLLAEKYGGVESDLSACGLTPAQAEAFHADCKRLAVGEPLGYVIGYIPFLDCKIWLDSKPLIPRPETEFWVKKAITKIKTKISTGSSCDLSQEEPVEIQVLDLCAGSGCIGVSVAKAIPEAHVTFGEIDPAHLPTIGKNLEENEIGCNRYKVFQSDLFSSRSDLELGKFDFILSNPPYIDPAVDRAEQSVKVHEPHQALYGGQDGMELIEKIISESLAHLNPGGQLWLEHEPEQTSQINNLATKSHFVAITHLDQYGIERYSVFSVSEN